MRYLKNTIEFEGKKYYLTWIPGNSYEEFSPIKQAYGFCFDKNGRLLVRQNDFNIWQVMGGTVEFGETPEETLIRELDEEVNIEVERITYLGAQKIVDDIGQISYQLRYGAIISRLKQRKPDPCNGKIMKRKFIDPRLYGRISGWGLIGDSIVDEAIKKLFGAAGETRTLTPFDTST